ncbi:MAG TPA: thermonuclease family protein [Dehalococcoidia bacterium]|nr:thermonuclease family protein [Dehalococcoidia bacterium]
MPGREIARVTRVVDGDTIDVELNGAIVRIRYIGMDTPETVDPNNPVECFGHEASEKNFSLVNDRVVELEKDVSETDRFGRLLRYVYVDGRMVNEELVLGGYATAATFPPDVKYQERFAAAEVEAREADRGLWGTCVGTAPTPVVSSGCPEGCASPPPGCEIKGNINSSGVRIYHVPSGEFYDVTVIDTLRGERWFCTADEAVANGWRASQR